jgi:hypothetical protein
VRNGAAPVHDLKKYVGLKKWARPPFRIFLFSGSPQTSTTTTLSNSNSFYKSITTAHNNLICEKQT